MNEKILVVGDNHLSSSNRSNHTDYSQEGIEALEFIVNIIKERGITHYVGLGDITYGKFDLAFRAKVDQLYNERHSVLDGKVYELRGNHDITMKGISEWEYYNTHRKLINNFDGIVKVTDGYSYYDVDGLRMHFVDYGAEDCDLVIKEDSSNIAFTHNYFRFKDSIMPNFGKSIELDTKENWFGVDAIMCGHIHNNITIKGTMTKDGVGKEIIVYYPGNLIRTDYLQDMPSCGEVLIITNGESVSFEKVSVPWWSEEKAFQVGDIIKEKKKVDISDIVKTLNDRERNIGDPETVIHNMAGFDDKYKVKAVELLREGLN